jgi:uncharacterized protein
MEFPTMDRHDRQAIDSLFEKLANVEQQSPPRDADAESFIDEQIARQPHAPYYMAQTIVVQELALNAAQLRIEELEQEVASGHSSGGGLVSSIFGDSRQRPQPTGSVPRAGRSKPIPSEAFQRMSQRAGGGFLAGAAQTAMGVAGGILLGNMITGMLGSDRQQAAEPQADNTGAEDASLEDGFDEGGFGDIDI